MSTLTSHILPASQRRTTEELTDDLDLTAGDRESKESAFWVMLVLAAVIASAGVIADSTATVIGAMIIAPLATPIMGMALGIAKREPGSTAKAGRFVLLGAVIVIGIGALFNLGYPGQMALLDNPQVAGRTSPGLLDLLAAVATGFAGAIALARRDVAAILPGVAIAISLVPPLAVVGICLGQGAYALAVGALLLFLSNLLALVLAGTIVFATIVLSDPDHQGHGSRRKTYLTLGLLFVVIAIPLAANSVGNYLLQVWTGRVETTAQAWLSEDAGARVESVDFAANRLVVRVQTPNALPPVGDLMADLSGQIPEGIPVVVYTSVGQQIQAGVVGQQPAS